MSYTLKTFLAAGSLLATMLTLVFVGKRFGAARSAKYGPSKNRGTIVETSVFAVLALLMSFLFYGALGRFDEHRRLLGHEVATLGTTYHRLDLLPEPSRSHMKELFRDYVDSRIELYQSGVDPSSEAARRSAALRERLWKDAVAGCVQPECSTPAANLMFSGLNETFAYPLDQAVMRGLHPPWIVFAMLFGLALLCAFLAGLDQAEDTRHIWFRALVYPVTMSTITWVILDLEFPRIGIFKVTSFDDMLIALRAAM